MTRQAAQKKAVQPKKINKAIAKAPKQKPAANRKAQSGPKWNLADLKMGQFLSMTSYMTVLNINHLVAVRNQYGHTMQMSQELLETMYSATHYAREVGLNMTGMAELL